MASLGILAAAGLGYAAKIFYVEVDPKVQAVEGALPGANCGGCGFPGCSAAALAIAGGKASASICVAGGPGTLGPLWAEVMGVAVEYREREVAKVKCRGGTPGRPSFRLPGRYRLSSRCFIARRGENLRCRLPWLGYLPGQLYVRSHHFGIGRHTHCR